MYTVTLYSYSYECRIRHGITANPGKSLDKPQTVTIVALLVLCSYSYWYEG